MNKKIRIKIVLDFFMVIALVLLANTAFTGILFHEIMGVIICGVFLIHVVLNRKWILAIKEKFLLRKYKMKDIIMILLNFMLFISEFITPIFTNIVTNRSLVISIHVTSSICFLVLCSIHLGIHLDYLISVIKVIFDRYSSNIIKRSIAIIFATVTIMVLMVIPMSVYINNKELSKQATIAAINEPNNNSLTITGDNDNSSALNNFLSNLRCTACGKHCSLLSPRCGKGQAQAEQAKIQFNNEDNASN